jgi:hypothetical protein
MQERVWVNEERTVFVRMWNNGTVEVATREHKSHTWGPPEYLKEETSQAQEQSASMVSRS